MRSLWFGKIVLIIFVLFILFFLTGSASAENQQKQPYKNQQAPSQEKEAIIFPSNSPPYFNYFAPPRQHRFSQNYPRYYPRYSYPNYSQNYQYPGYYPQYYSYPQDYTQYYNRWPRYYIGPSGLVAY